MSSAGPQHLRLKRKRNEPAAPNVLILEPGPRAKRSLTAKEAARAALQYRRQVDDAADGEGLRGDAGQAGVGSTLVSRGGSARRTFHLTRPRHGGARRPANVGKGDGASEARDLATFVEASGPPSRTRLPSKSVAEDGDLSVEDAPLKRPGKRSAVTVGQAKAAEGQMGKRSGVQNEQRLASVADTLHQFALDEIPQQRITALPKHTVRRRDIEAARPQAREPVIRDDEMDVDSEHDYVYDTYVLAPAHEDATASEGHTDGEMGNVGYLVIADEDQSIWETYLEDEESDKEYDTDDADSNAEDFYGADYPEDELASDDEYDRDVHGYRVRGAADDEEWDEDTGAYSDDEYDRTMNPWKARTPAQFARASAFDDEDDA